MDPVVELNTGFVRGLVEKHEDNFNYYAFKGIPFAEPPIGELRFQDPVPKKKWLGVLDCKKFGAPCVQHDNFTNKESYDENCLHLNVYTRSINEPSIRKPVLVWIHGGDFMYGTADDTYCGPDYLIRKNIVLVTINFRLGVMGFLDLEDEVAPGNQGLKDQVMALQWVQKNVRMFGGDPNNVTVGGATAGSVCAHSLALSPLSKDLLHKIILHANVMFNPWAAGTSPRSNALKLCSVLGKTLTDSKEIVKFLKTVDAKDLLKAQELLRDILVHIPFGPGLDSKASVPFMPADRYTVANQGVHIPSLVGHTSHEGLILLHDSFFFRNCPRKDYFTACDLDFGKLVIYNSEQILERYNLNQQQLRRLYYKRESISEKNLDKFIEFIGDMHLIEGIQRFVRVQADLSSAVTYFFRFEYDSQKSLSKLLLKNAPSRAAHLDDVQFLFKKNIIKGKGGEHFEKGSLDYKLMEQMTEMWTNFMTYGRPTVQTSDLIPVNWLPVADGTVIRHMNIGVDLTMQSMVNVDQKLLSARQIKA